MLKINLQLRWLGCVLFLAVLGCDSKPKSSVGAPTVVSSGSHESKKLIPAKAFSLMDESGKSISLADFSGSLVILHFWASWCGPCIDELPEVIRSVKRFKDEPGKKKVVLLAVSLDTEWKDAKKIFPQDEKSDRVISILDPTSQVSNLYGSYQFPETYLISPDQKIITKWVGPQKWDQPELVAFIEKSRN